MSKGLPAALQLKAFPKTGSMKIQTVVLEPQLAQNNFVRYVLERRAILASDSIFTFSLVPNPAAAGLKPTLPINTGIGCIIKNCTLRLGNVVISRTQDWAFYNTVAKCFESPETRTLKDTVVNGSLGTMRPSTKTDGQFSLQNATYTSDDSSDVPNQLNLGNNPIFSIKLSELFPALKGMQIPLGHLESNMVIEFELNEQLAGTQGILAHMNDAEADGEAYVVTPNYAEMSMLADYLSFDDATHDEIDDIINGGKGLLMPFHEIVTVMGQIESQATEAEVPILQELGLAGRVVKSVVVADSSAAGSAVATQKDKLEGIYDLAYPGVTNTQLKINDLNVYPRPMTSVTNHITELESVFQAPLGITRPEYIDGQGGMDTNVDFGGTKLNNLNGKRHSSGVPLISNPMTRRGTRVLDKPIRYERTIVRAAGKPALTSRYFCSVEKAFAIRDGQVSVMV